MMVEYKFWLPLFIFSTYTRLLLKPCAILFSIQTDRQTDSQTRTHTHTKFPNSFVKGDWRCITINTVFVD